MVNCRSAAAPVTYTLLQGMSIALPTTLLSIPLGRLVDRTNRARLLVVHQDDVIVAKRVADYVALALSHQQLAASFQPVLREHRELLIVDGKVAFVGGSGWADHWFISTEKRKRWRDTMVRQPRMAAGFSAR